MTLVPFSALELPVFYARLTANERQQAENASPFDRDLNAALTECAGTGALAGEQLALRCDQFGQRARILIVHQALAFFHEAADAPSSAIPHAPFAVFLIVLSIGHDLPFLFLS